MEKMKAVFKKGGLSVVAGSSFVASMAHADADALATAAQAGITAAQTSGMTVGGYIIGAVAALAVIGLIIALVRKI